MCGGGRRRRHTSGNAFAALAKDNAFALSGSEVRCL
jgi:hypothetical protein